MEFETKIAQWCGVGECGLTTHRFGYRTVFGYGRLHEDLGDCHNLQSTQTSGEKVE